MVRFIFYIFSSALADIFIYLLSYLFHYVFLILSWFSPLYKPNLVQSALLQNQHMCPLTFYICYQRHYQKTIF